MRSLVRQFKAQVVLAVLSGTKTNADACREYQLKPELLSKQIGHFLEEVYQQKRIHSALGYLTPVEFEATWRQAQAEHGLD